MRLSDKIGELELVDLPMLPSLERNSSVSQCYERVSGSDAEERAGPNADTSENKGRPGRHNSRIILVQRMRRARCCLTDCFKS